MPNPCNCSVDEGEGRACDACTDVSRRALVTFWTYFSTVAAAGLAAGVIASHFPF